MLIVISVFNTVVVFVAICLGWIYGFCVVDLLVVIVVYFFVCFVFSFVVFWGCFFFINLIKCMFLQLLGYQVVRYKSLRMIYD